MMKMMLLLLVALFVAGCGGTPCGERLTELQEAVEGQLLFCNLPDDTCTADNFASIVCRFRGCATCVDPFRGCETCVECEQCEECEDCVEFLIR